MTLGTLVSAVAMLFVGFGAFGPARLPAEFSVERMAMCQDSWLDWKDDPVQVKKFATGFQAGFVQKDGDAFFVPRAKTTVVGLPISRVFPESVGMAVGFSVMVEASFDQTRKNVEKALGKSLKNCETGDSMRTCGLELGEKKTVLLMAEDTGASKTTLLGCYYYYAK